MARIIASEIIDDVNGYLQQSLSSVPQYPGDNIVVAAVRASADEISPMLPSTWHDDESKRIAVLNLGGYAAPANLQAGMYPLPDDCLAVSSFDLNELNQKAYVIYDGADFAARKARMGRLPVPGLFEMIFYQIGRNLHYWYVPAVIKAVQMTYITRCADPANNGGYFLFAERARPLIVAHAVATLKLKDLKPDDYKVLWDMFVSKWQMAVVGQYTAILNDPFRRRGQPVIPVGGQQGNQ
jgi:hypothetical protein